MGILDEEGVIKVDGETAKTGARVHKNVRLPRDADHRAASASHVDGLFTVAVPKKAAAEAKKEIVVDAATDVDVEMMA